ncbi:cytochrome b6-f complex subunit PetN [Deinococcus antarcticus]|uniref:Cytochrome b6-f complex subunit PetN n=1 Tax=Deinococcus antarcticus TaxID=1298767 RepID=A0ABV8A0P5_9DEIO
MAHAHTVSTFSISLDVWGRSRALPITCRPSWSCGTCRERG